MVGSDHSAKNRLYVLAVSGGVDSVVLLDKFCHKYSQEQIIVAHFDHGMREDSAADERFVAGLAAKHGLRYVSDRKELGENASEATAREARYEFLKRVADQYKATLVTAHHANDVVESIAINIVRGTGWRGLSVMSDDKIYRPLLNLTKNEMIKYAIDHHLEWVEDETNHSGVYLRNMIRRLTTPGSIQAVELGNLRSRQLLLKRQIEVEAGRLLEGNKSRRRYFFTQVDVQSADEMLRMLLVDTAGTPLTRPQRFRMLMAIKVGQPGTEAELGEGVVMKLSRDEFEVATIKK